LQLNSLGTTAERLIYRGQLVTYFQAHISQLDEDSQRRLQTNPLRILDSKNPAMAELVANAPALMDYLGEDSRQHFQSITAQLDNLGIAYDINLRLVRGLDYYGKTVFEWVTDELGSQGTVCAGGRYDGLIEQLGGKASHAVGFAMGIERLLALMETAACYPLAKPVDVFMIRVGEAAEAAGLLFAEQLRDALPTLKLQVNCGGGSFKSQFKKADKSGADFALILGDDEATQGIIGCKPLRSESPQQSFNLSQAIGFLGDYLKNRPH